MQDKFFFSPALNSVQASILHSTVYIVNVHVHVLMDLLLCHQMVSHQSLDDILYMYVNKCVSLCVCVCGLDAAKGSVDLEERYSSQWGKGTKQRQSLIG